MRQNDIKAYASSFASFLIEKIGDKIDRIILYGSVAKGEATKESDVDIFVDTEKDIEDDVKKVLEEFYNSREATLFKTKGIGNEIVIKVGRLKDWKELHRSITSTGITLWGSFEAKERPIGTRHKIIFYWEKVKGSRGAFLNKLYGFKTKRGEYKGLLEKWNGKKIGKSSILIPAKYKDEMIEIIKKYKADAKSIEVFTLE